MDSSEPSGSRRDLLGYAAWGMGLTAVGAGLWTVIGATMTPQELESDVLVVDLADLPIDAPRLLRLDGKPVTVWRRNSEQVAHEQAVDLTSLRDPLARNANLSPDATAEDANRSLGDVIALEPACTRMGCVMDAGIGDFGGWYCPCCASHYDIAGRIRKGAAPRNLTIPKYILSSDILTIYPEGSGPLSNEQRDRLLRGDG